MFLPVLSLLIPGQSFSDEIRKPNIIRQGEGVRIKGAKELGRSRNPGKWIGSV